MSVEAFSGKASVYAAARPGYPAAAADYLTSLLPESGSAAPPGVVADVGAGTGKLTELFAQRGIQVYGIEPNDDMRAHLALALVDYPDAKAIVGSAEDTTLPDNSVDLIVCAQALHWFDAESFWKECQRIGKPNAIVAAVYNNMDGGRGGLHRQTAVDEFFTDPVITEFDSSVSYSRDTWRDYMLSHSHSPLPSDDSYADYLKEIDEIFDAEQVDGKLTRIVTTTVYTQRVHDEAVATATSEPGLSGRVLRPRHWAFIIFTALAILAEIWFGTHYRLIDATEVAMPIENDASDEEILEAFSEFCDNEPEAAPEWDDRFTAVYQCTVGNTYLWLSIDRSNGDYLHYVTLQPCFEDLAPTNVISGGRWMVDMVEEPIPDNLAARFPQNASRWYCPPDEESSLP